MAVYIPHNKPSVGKAEIKAVAEAIKSRSISNGKKVAEFENRLCRYVGLPDNRAVAVSSGTAALYLALRILGIDTDDEVVAPTYVCSAILNAIYMAGARPVLTDVGARDFNISVPEVKEAINRRTRAIIVPHIFGVPAEAAVFAGGFKIPIIEDCATALGARIKSSHVGLSGDIAVYSFYASKVITTGQGGMLVSKSREYVNKARDYREFDFRKNYYPRFNFQMTDIEAAMGMAQLDKLEGFLKRRKAMAQRYEFICSQKGWRYQQPENSMHEPNWYRFVLIGAPALIRRLKRFLGKNRIETIVPIQKWELLHNYLRRSPRFFKTAEKIAQSSLSLPIYPGLMDKGDFDVIINALTRF